MNLEPLRDALAKARPGSWLEFHLCHQLALRAVEALPGLLAESDRKREVIEAWHDIDRKRDAEMERLREALRTMRDYGCPVCSGDCASANPPVSRCPMQMMSTALKEPSHDEG